MRGFEKIQRSVMLSSSVNDFGKLLVITGLLLALVGLMLWAGVGRNWLGRLPGDIHYSRGHFNFYFPVVTCVLVSFFLTLILWLLRK